MNNFGTIYRFEVRKILKRKLTITIITILTIIMIAMNIGEYVAGGNVINKEEKILVGRTVDDSLLSEMRAATKPKQATTNDGETLTIGISINNKAYEPLIDYLYMIGGNFDRAYHMSEKKLYSTFDGVIDDALGKQHLTDKEIAYWETKRAKNQKKLTYDKIQNAWGDSVTIIYIVSLLALIGIAATLSGVFSDESLFKTDSLIFSALNGKKKLFCAKFLAGITIGMAETVILLSACIGTEFALSGTDGMHGSVQFFVGPTAMDMEIIKAFLWYVGIMLVIGFLFSVLAMFLSEICRSSIAVVSVMMFLWLLSALNIPDSMGFIARVWNFLPVTFLGSWTFTDYHLVWFFGKPLTIIEAAPIIYIISAVIMTAITKISYNKYQVK